MKLTLDELILVARMSACLEGVADCDSRVQRSAAYVLGGFSDAEILRFDRIVHGNELTRRRIFGRMV